MSLPWAIVGDYNAIRILEERTSTTDIDEMQDFNEWIQACELMEMRTSGGTFTWSNKQDGADRIWSRLDRCLINDEWLRNIDTQLEVKGPGISDHSSLHILSVNFCRKNVQFRYCTMWESHHDFQHIVKQNWEKRITGCKLFQCCKKLQLVKFDLKKLHRRRFAKIHEYRDQLKLQLEKVKEGLATHPNDHTLQQEEKDTMRTYTQALKNSFSLLKQQSKFAWIDEGDECSTLFFNSIKLR